MTDTHEPQDDVTDVTDELSDDEELFDGDEQDVIEKLIAQRDEYLDQLQRSRAEFINYRKRTDAEKLRLGEMFTASTLAQFLPILDDFDRAFSLVPDDERDEGWMTGFSMIQKKLVATLERAGVTEVPGVGTPFDPAVHEAVAADPATGQPHVVEVYQKGYRLNDALLRAAMVRTGEAPADTTPDENEPNA